MSCYHPLEAFRRPGEAIYFKEVKDSQPIKIPCGHCIGCKLARVRGWAVRCMHEAQMHDFNSFVTLTYENPDSPSLEYSDFQRFMRRVRRSFPGGRFFACGEYGSVSVRPHWHALLFGVSFSDGVSCGKDICSSRKLSELWPYGFSSFGNVTFQSASYVASYAVKSGGVSAAGDYVIVDPDTGECDSLRRPFVQMSRRPGIGASWFAKYWRDVYLARDGVVQQGGREIPPPRYYDKLLAEFADDLHEEKSYERYVRSGYFVEDSTRQRLAVREACAVARQQLKRTVL